MDDPERETRTRRWFLPAAAAAAVGVLAVGLAVSISSQDDRTGANPGPAVGSSTTRSYESAESAGSTETVDVIGPPAVVTGEPATREPTATDLPVYPTGLGVVSPWTPDEDAASLGSGTLDWDGSCFTLSLSGVRGPAVFPPGYSVTVDGGVAVVRDADGEEVLRDGAVLVGGRHHASPADVGTCVSRGDLVFAIGGGKAPFAVDLPTSGWQEGMAGRQAAASGYLVWDGTCLTLGSPGAGEIGILWPAGYRAEADDFGLQVLDERGHAVLSSGQWVAFGGSMLEVSGERVSDCTPVGTMAFSIGSDPSDLSLVDNFPPPTTG